MDIATKNLKKHVLGVIHAMHEDGIADECYSLEQVAEARRRN